MEKFRFTPIHFVIMGVISFGILAILLRVLGSGILMLVVLFFGAGYFDFSIDFPTKKL